MINGNQLGGADQKETAVVVSGATAAPCRLCRFEPDTMLHAHNACHALVNNGLQSDSVHSLFMHFGVSGNALTFLPQPYHLLAGSRDNPSGSPLITRPRQVLIAPRHTPTDTLALVVPKNVQATATPRQTTALFLAMDAKHPPDKHPKLQGNLWVYVGNLDWELPVAQVGW